MGVGLREIKAGDPAFAARGFMHGKTAIMAGDMFVLFARHGRPRLEDGGDSVPAQARAPCGKLFTLEARQAMDYATAP